MSIPPSTGLLHALGGIAQAKPAVAPRPAPWLGPALPAAGSAVDAERVHTAPSRPMHSAAGLERTPEAPRPNLPRGSLIDVKV